VCSLSIFVAGIVVIKTEYVITCPHLVETTLVASRANQQVYRYMATGQMAAGTCGTLG